MSRNKSEDQLAYEERQKAWDALVQSCPLLFDGKDSYYFACGSGWHDLLKELCLKLEALIAAMPEKDRYYDWEDGSPREERTFTVAQVKEKFATLRFYMSGYPDGADDLIAEAEVQSAKTCESCGQPGEPRKTGWIKTYCNAHYEDYLQEQEARRERNVKERAEREAAKKADADKE